jgi:hypothetical protein
MVSAFSIRIPVAGVNNHRQSFICNFGRYGRGKRTPVKAAKCICADILGRFRRLTDTGSNQYLRKGLCQAAQERFSGIPKW